MHGPVRRLIGPKDLFLTDCVSSQVMFERLEDLVGKYIAGENLEAVDPEVAEPLLGHSA